MIPIRLENVTKRFGDLVAVNGVDLDVEEGEFLVLVGPSGCGKSTLLRMIAGLETPTEGDLYIGNERVNDVAPKDRAVSMVFQNYALYPHMSAKRNMTFGINSKGSYSDEEIEQNVQNAAETLDLGDLLDRKPAQLSGGEQQRVAMGRALIRDPGVFLLDEPLSNLDAKLRDQMRTELSTLHEEIKTTTVYVTHDQTEAMTLGDRVAVMNAGKVEQIDPPQRVYDFPETKFVADFIGSPRMNMIDVEITNRDGTYYASNGPFQVALHRKDGLRDLEGERLTLGVRPDDVYLAESRAGSNESDPFQTEVMTTEPLGDVMVLHTLMDDQQFRVQTNPRTTLGPGDRVDIVVDLDRVHLFDPKTGMTVYHSDPNETVSKSPRAP